MCFGAFGWGGGFGWMGGMFGGLMMVLFWGALIALGFFAVRALTRSSGHSFAGSVGYGPPPGRVDNTALNLLKERYARGEITKESYEQMRSDLRA
jgi:putative membrane protein